MSSVLQEFDKPIVNAVQQLKRREFLCESRVTDSVKCLGKVERDNDGIIINSKYFVDVM